MITMITRNAVKISASFSTSDEAAVSMTDMRNDINVTVRIQTMLLPFRLAAGGDFRLYFLPPPGRLLLSSKKNSSAILCDEKKCILTGGNMLS
jgi:hypothetical protein